MTVFTVKTGYGDLLYESNPNSKIKDLKESVLNTVEGLEDEEGVFLHDDVELSTLNSKILYTVNLEDLFKKKPSMFKEVYKNNKCNNIYYFLLSLENCHKYYEFDENIEEYMDSSTHKFLSGMYYISDIKDKYIEIKNEFGDKDECLKIFIQALRTYYNPETINLNRLQFLDTKSINQILKELIGIRNFIYSDDLDYDQDVIDKIMQHENTNVIIDTLIKVNFEKILISCKKFDRFIPKNTFKQLSYQQKKKYFEATVSNKSSNGSVIPSFKHKFLISAINAPMFDGSIFSRVTRATEHILTDKIIDMCLKRPCMNGMYIIYALRKSEKLKNTNLILRCIDTPHFKFFPFDGIEFLLLNFFVFYAIYKKTPKEDMYRLASFVSLEKRRQFQLLDEYEY